jgi:hypothetical protein
MRFIDKIKNAAGNNSDKIEGALDKAGDAIDRLDGDVDQPRT